jgi:molecular chaperone GrpE
MPDEKDAATRVAEEKLEQKAIPIEVKHIRKEADEPIRVTDKRFWVQEEQGAQEEKPEEAPPSFKPSYDEELEKQLAATQKKLDEVIASYREFKAETTADAQKVRQRIQNDYNRRLAKANAEVARKFVDVLENLDRAKLASAASQNFETLLDGVKLIQAQFISALNELGVEEIAVLNTPFNPEVAEAVELVVVKEESQDNMVVEVISNGYRLKEVLVRPARVKVGKCQAKIPEHVAS